MIGLVCVTLSITSACATRAQQLSAQPLTPGKSLSSSDQSNSSVLVYPLIDERGGEYAYLYPTSLIPVVDFFHIGNRSQYPETAGLVSNQGGRATVTHGSLAPAFPYLMAAMVREMRLTSNVTPIDQINSKVDLTTFDYVIMGKLKRTTLKTHVNLIPLALLGIIGVPYAFTNYELEYEIELYRGGRVDEPIYSETYTYRRKKAVGFYYNGSAHFDMFIGGLEDTLPRAVQDIAAAISADRESAPAAPAADQMPSAVEPTPATEDSAPPETEPE